MVVMYHHNIPLMWLGRFYIHAINAEFTAFSPLPVSLGLPLG